jgi:hypothetical protein
MDTEWSVRREIVVRSDGQRQWDRAYQHLLRWASQQDQWDRQEVHDASGLVCPCINAESSAHTDHRAASDAAAGRRPGARMDTKTQEEHIYRDEGYSGASLNRPGLDALRDQVALAAYDVVLLTAPDRLARKYVHQMLVQVCASDVGPSMCIRCWSSRNCSSTAVGSSSWSGP